VWLFCGYVAGYVVLLYGCVLWTSVFALWLRLSLSTQTLRRRQPQDLWRAAYCEMFPSTPEDVTVAGNVEGVDPATDPEYAEPTVDTMRAQKDEELARCVPVWLAERGGTPARQEQPCIIPVWGRRDGLALSCITPLPSLCNSSVLVLLAWLRRPLDSGANLLAETHALLRPRTHTCSHTCTLARTLCIHAQVPAAL